MRAAIGHSGKPVILFVINSLAGGGAERVFVTLVRNSELRRERYEIVVALLDDEADEAYRLPEWVTVVRLASGGSLLKSALRLRRLARTLRPACILSFLTRANVAAVIAARSSRCRVVISERVNTAAHLATGRFAWISRAIVSLTYPRADRIIAVSQGVKDTLAAQFGVPGQHIRVVANPVDGEHIRGQGRQDDPLGAGPLDWVTMGRLVPNKNVALAIEGFSRSGLPGRLLVLGEGPQREALAASAQRLGISDRVVFAGFQSNPYAIIARAGAYCLPSNAEGFPNALVEAMALGRPVVATDCPSGPAEILEVQLNGREIAAGTGGMLVECGNPDAMGQAMARLAQPETRRDLGSAAQRRAGDFSVSRAVDAFWDEIEAS